MTIEEIKKRLEICKCCSQCQWLYGKDAGRYICSKNNVNILQVKNCDKLKNH